MFIVGDQMCAIKDVAKQADATTYDSGSPLDLRQFILTSETVKTSNF